MLNRLLSLIALLAVMIVCEPACARGLKILHEGQSGRLIIFVHGLDGDAETSFTHPSRLNSLNSQVRWPTRNQSWLQMLATDEEKDKNGYAPSQDSIATLPIPASRSDGFNIHEVSNRFREDLVHALSQLKVEHIVFVTHSLGGLVVQRALLVDQNASRPAFLPKTRMLVLIATPAGGSQVASLFAMLTKDYLGRLVVDLKTLQDNAYLQSLQEDWQSLFAKRSKEKPPFVLACAYEKQALVPFLVIVPRQSLDSTCRSPYPVAEDHINIAKPVDRSADIYVWLRNELRQSAALWMPPEPKKGEMPPAKDPGAMVVSSNTPQKKATVFVRNSLRVFAGTPSDLDREAAAKLRAALARKGFSITADMDGECHVFVYASLKRAGGVVITGSVADAGASDASVAIESRQIAPGNGCAPLAVNDEIKIQIAAHEDLTAPSVRVKALDALFRSVEPKLPSPKNAN